LVLNNLLPINAAIWKITGKMHKISAMDVVGFISKAKIILNISWNILVIDFAIVVKMGV
jgi:hypothetical protein